MTVRVSRTVALQSGRAMPALGVSTWGFAEDPGRRAEELATVRECLDLGLGLIDTGPWYADGGAERVVGEAIAGRRDEAFVVGKLGPDDATRDGLVAACRASLRRLGTDHLDLYLLRRRGRVPLEDTIEGFHRLLEAGQIRAWGVGDFDVPALAELRVLGGTDVAVEQVLYNLVHRGIEYDLLPWCAERRIALIAYLPHEAGRLLRHMALSAVAARHDVKPAQVALAWVLRHEHMSAVPRADTPAQVRENRAALDLRLTARDIVELDETFPRPVAPRRLAVHDPEAIPPAPRRAPLA
jgi:diketogulonate reductase-like aldo/keto reductase